MYNPGDYVVVSRYGICRIDSVGHLSLSCADPSVDYYTLCPVSEDCVIYIPCSISSEHLRPVITKEQALDLIKSIPAIKIKKVKDKQRTQRYKDAVDSCNPATSHHGNMADERRDNQERQADKQNHRGHHIQRS